jgi:hypothetical protein
MNIIHDHVNEIPRCLDSNSLLISIISCGICVGERFVLRMSNDNRRNELDNEIEQQSKLKGRRSLSFSKYLFR